MTASLGLLSLPNRQVMSTRCRLRDKVPFICRLFLNVFLGVGERSGSHSIQTRTLCPTFAILIPLWYYTVYRTNRFFRYKLLKILSFPRAWFSVNPQVPGSSPGRGAKILESPAEVLGFFVGPNLGGQSPP